MANPKTKLYPSLKIYADMDHFQFLWAYKKAPHGQPTNQIWPPCLKINGEMGPSGFYEPIVFCMFSLSFKKFPEQIY